MNKEQLEKARLTPEERKLRDLLWASHACAGKYSDDGELQCGCFLPPIDFLRDTPDEIERKTPIHYAQLTKVLKRIKDVCPKCLGRKVVLWHDRQVGGEFKGADREKPCPTCQGTSKKDSAMEDRIAGVHLSYCYQNEHKDSCKFSDKNCPAKPQDNKIREILERDVVFDGGLVTPDNLDELCSKINALFNEDDIRKDERNKWRQKCEELLAVRHEISTKEERERIMKIFASFGKIQLKKPLSGKKFEALFD